MKLRATLLASSLLLGCQGGIDGGIDINDPENPAVIGKDRAPQDVGGIIGGSPASTNQFRTVVSVIVDFGAEGVSICTGTLIAPDLVATAAHCIDPATLGLPNQAEVTTRTFVIFDRDDLFQPGGFFVDAADTDPDGAFNINRLGRNDVGVVRLVTPVTDRAPTPIDTRNRPNLVGVTVTKVGYGLTDPSDPDSVGRLFQVQNTSFSCRNIGQSDNNLICYDQRDGTGTCSGDSGGPAFLNVNGVQTLVGITSFGDRNCALFAADTKVAAENDFILSFF